MESGHSGVNPLPGVDQLWSTGTGVIEDCLVMNHPTKLWSVVWNILYSSIYCVIIPTDFHSIIFQRGWLKPPTRNWCSSRLVRGLLLPGVFVDPVTPGGLDMLQPSVVCQYHRIGWWENLQETPIFDGKNHGQWFPVDFPLNQSIDSMLGMWHRTRLNWPRLVTLVGQIDSSQEKGAVMFIDQCQTQSLRVRKVYPSVYPSHICWDPDPDRICGSYDHMVPLPKP